MAVWIWMAISIIVLLPLILILSLPFSFALLAKRDEEYYFAAVVSWLQGGITFKMENKNGSLMLGRFALKKFPIKRAESAGKKAGSKKERKSSKAFNARQYLNIEFIPSLFKALRQIWAALSIKIEGKASFGFEDPALTGLTYGFLSTAGLAARYPGLALTPNFLEPGFEGFLSVRSRFTLGKVLFILGRFLLSRPARRLWWPRLRRKEVANKWQKSTLSIT